MRTLLTLLACLLLPAFGEEGRLIDAGKTTTIRLDHTATLLKDGRVLLAGGSTGAYVPSGQSIVRTAIVRAELFDPATGAFTATGDMVTPRYGHTATLLPDGKVLIEQGVSPFEKGVLPVNTVKTAEVYDPSTGTFAPAGAPLPSSTLSPTLMLNDGRLVEVDSEWLKIYRIENNLRQLVETYSFGSIWFDRKAALLADGTVLIAGGWYAENYYEDGISTGEAFVFDPRLGTLRKTGSLSELRFRHTVTPLPDGTALVTGGHTDGTALVKEGVSMAAVEIYNPRAGQFSFVGHAPSETTTMLLDGRVLLTGGATASLYYPRDFVLSATGISDRVSPGSLASLYGPLLSAKTEAADIRSPRTTLADVRLDVIDRFGATRPARLLFVSPTQINFEVPTDSLPGELKYIVHTPGQKDREIQASLSNVSPSLFAFAENRAAAYTLHQELDGGWTATLATEPIVLDSRPAYLVLYATGVRGRSGVSDVVCTIDGVDLPVEYAGPAGEGIPGLDQVNVRLPETLSGRGVVDLVLKVDGVQSNAVAIEVH